jgi:hypothetical protein
MRHRRDKNRREVLRQLPKSVMICDAVKNALIAAEMNESIGTISKWAKKQLKPVYFTSTKAGTSPSNRNRFPVWPLSMETRKQEETDWETNPFPPAKLRTRGLAL